MLVVGGIVLEGPGHIAEAEGYRVLLQKILILTLATISHIGKLLPRFDFMNKTLFSFSFFFTYWQVR